MKITLKDGSVMEYDQPKSAYDIALDISQGLARVACLAEIDGEEKDLRTMIDHDATLNILTFDDPRGKRAYRHTTSHVLAEAVKHLYPDVKLAIGRREERGQGPPARRLEGQPRSVGRTQGQARALRAAPRRGHRLDEGEK